jgi:initiation factor 1A
MSNRNTHGGNKYKSQARKHNNSGGNTRLRVVEFDGEYYGVVTKMLGNNMFHVFCIDGETRLGHIRGKFTGRNKRDNLIEPGVWVIVGERFEKKDTTDKSSKLIHCDLLEVYKDSDKEKLKNSVLTVKWELLVENDPSKGIGNKTQEDDILFATDKDIEYQELTKDTNQSSIMVDNEIIDVDDI